MINQPMRQRLLCSKGTNDSFFPMLFDWNPGPTNSTIRRIPAQIVTEDRQTTQTLVVVMARPVDGWMDVVKKEVRSAAVQIKMMPSWCRYFLWTCRAVAGSGCTDKTRVSPPLRLFHSSAFIFICACIWTIISCMRLSWWGREKGNELGSYKQQSATTQ